MTEIPWPESEALEALPANHRRVVAAVLRGLEKRLSALAVKGIAEVPEGGLDMLRELGDAAQGRPQQTNVRSLLAALRVLADDLEPQRLAGYGALDARQAATLHGLAEAIRALLAEVEGRL